MDQLDARRHGLLLASFYPRQAMWVMLWVPVQGWFQINVFNDSTETVLLYEFQIAAIYVLFSIAAMRFPRAYSLPPAMWKALPFVVWTLVMVPSSLDRAGAILTGIGLRTYLLPLPLVWIGYHSFTSRRELGTLGALVSLEAAVVGVVAALQYANLVTPSGGVIDVPTGFGMAGALRPPGTFSSPGHLGMYVLAVVPLCVGRAFEAKGWRRISHGLGLVGAAVALVVNSQRATVVLLFVSLTLMVLLTRGATAIKAVTAAMAVAAVGILLGLFIVGDAFGDRVRSITDDVDYTVRVAPIERMTDAMQRPLTGGGLGTAPPGMTRFDLESINAAESFGAALVYQLGVPGIVLFAVLLGSLLEAGHRAFLKCRGRDLELLVAGILTYEVTICLQSWSYDPLHYPPSRALFWFWARVLVIPSATCGSQQPYGVGRTICRHG